MYVRVYRKKQRREISREFNIITIVTFLQTTERSFTCLYSCVCVTYVRNVAVEFAADAASSTQESWRPEVEGQYGVGLV